MRLTQRLLLASLLVVGVLVLFILVVVDLRLREGLLTEARRELEREARVIAALWEPDSDPQLIAQRAGRALEHRVTLMLPNGHPVGDSELAPERVAQSGDLRLLPEVAAALESDVGWDHTRTARGGEELRVAVVAPQGVVRVVYDLSHVSGVFGRARRDLIAAGAIALLLAGLFAVTFARTVSRPLEALRDVTRGLAAGDLSRRPALTAPGEVGDLADAIHRLAEQLEGRLAALKAEEALLVALTEALNEGVVAVDRRQRVVRINEMARRLLNVAAEVPFAVEQLARERVLRDAVTDALNGEMTDSAEVTLGGRTLLLTARPLTGGDGGAVLALYDLTQLRRLEVTRRDFVANVSHELRTPLTVVGGFAETLADDDLPPAERKAFAETIRANAVRMQRIVDDLLDLSRIESGGWVPKPEAIPVRAVAAEAIAAVNSMAERSNTSLEVRVEPGAESVWADPTALRQVIGNLVDNAVRYTALGTVTILAERENGGTVIGVRDTGVGIPSDHLPRIFERFYRVDPARSREAGGTGLGLAVVRHLVESHGGRVQAESAVGQGTTIKAWFPDGSSS